MTRPLASALLAATLLTAVPPSAGGQPVDVIAGGPPLAVTLAAGGTRLVTIGARAGDYVRGTATARGGRITLDLLAPDGRALRRLVDDATGAAPFQFVAAETGMRLRLTTRGGAEVGLMVDPVLDEAAQAAAGAPDPVSPIIARLARSLAAGSTTDGFWAEVAQRGVPLVEDGPDGNAIVTFLVRGARRNARIFGAPNGDHEPLERIGGSDVWAKSFVVPRSTRLAYQIAVDVPDLPGSARERRSAILATAKADALNPRRWPADAVDDYAQSSVLELAETPPQPWVIPRDGARGTVTTFDLASAQLGNSREVAVYRPADFDPAAPETRLLVVFDGRAYRSKVPTPTILDNLIAAGKLPPVVAVFVDSIDAETRGRELPDNDRFADALVDEILPKALAKIGFSRPPAARTIIAGSSYGGLAAMTVALRRPEVFGNVLSLSGSFWWNPPGDAGDGMGHVAGRLARMPAPPLKVFLSAGLFEDRAGPGAGSLLGANRTLRDVLVAKGVAVTYRETATGHDYYAWRGLIADGLMALAGRAE